MRHARHSSPSPRRPPGNHGLSNSAVHCGTSSSPSFRLDQRLHLIRPPIGRQPHHLAALVPVGEDVARHAAVERAEARHEIELVAQEAARRVEPDLVQRLELGAVEPVVALRFARERVDALRELARLADVGRVVAHPVHDHHHALLERAGGERAVGVRQVVGDRHHLARRRAEQRARLGLRPLLLIHELRDVLVEETRLHVLDGEHVAVAHDQADVVERDALRLQAVVDDLLVEARGVLLARDALLADGVGDRAVAQQARAHVVVVGVDAEDVGLACRHARRFDISRPLMLTFATAASASAPQHRGFPVVVVRWRLQLALMPRTCLLPLVRASAAVRHPARCIYCSSRRKENLYGDGTGRVGIRSPCHDAECGLAFRTRVGALLVVDREVRSPPRFES